MIVKNCGLKIIRIHNHHIQKPLETYYIHTSVEEEVYSALMDARAENEFYSTAGLPDDYEGGVEDMTYIQDDNVRSFAQKLTTWKSCCWPVG